MRKELRRSRRALVAVLLPLALIAAACGDDGDEVGATGDGDTPTTQAAAGAVDYSKVTKATVDGCGDDSVGDPSADGPDRVIARCEPGYPAPVPLAEKTKLKVAYNFQVPSFGMLFLAQAMGEFEKENLEIELTQVPTVDALPLLATGGLDLSTGAVEASFWNALDRDLGVKQIMGASFSSYAGDLGVKQQGIWARADAFSDPRKPDLAELKGQTAGSAVGFTSIIMLPLEQALNEAGISIADLRVEQVPGTEMVRALENDAIQVAWVLDPYWKDLAASDDFVLVATNRPAEQTGGYLAGPHMFDKKREAGVAFARAMLRTINTYAADGLPDDPEVVNALAKALNMEPTTLTTVADGMMWDWEMRDWTAAQAQEVYMKLDQLQYDTPIRVEDALDRSLYLEALGAE